MLAFSEACERNKGPILEILRHVLVDIRLVLEIGSGTGQHAVHFARHLPHLIWQPSDRADYLPDLNARLNLEGSPNINPPLELDVGMESWPVTVTEAIFSANTLHIMPWREVRDFFRGAGKTVTNSGKLCVYGPFRYNGGYTSESNARFDLHLKHYDADSGIRDFEAVNALAEAQGLRLLHDYVMPANNQLLVWEKQ
jgi:hypothetical protein